ncbi:MAG: heme o synthase [Alphaproteobacteria bacterium]|uniref:Protoheme IX farnesyltransferase n=1 Tax=PS1 clade bacterium TaxID=2175152 RepID=A0A368DQM0_9PROT|nr:protoheme IX farnesyltransferase [Rhodobiaceae bacterium]MAU87274.1 protoheme IX farnesyltransferase [Rhodobiaceae bacterium]OUT73507.1 MAG: protoheme IX farnesyltransferase [Rhizobiales bacterium TMED25]OUT73953.1 MAG: protoheme IX farnesyltransferase [Rhizobiales bacterium TMED25]RCL74119.1 MAG: protoheme IX farnesyltransferase [PS1 clade bacterium]|tara:strand:+ start:3400 stop:4290 length:891 start_codon:yes stop_codon:yes gene_type:complete
MVYSSGSVYDYFTLMKPRVMSLVIFTSFVGLILSPLAINPFLACIAIICIAIGAGASGALNMWFDADIDSIMKRTSNRPIPSGNISKSEALTYGIIMAAGSVYVMGVLINWFSAIFLAFTIFFYVFIYTIWLKRKTIQNIVIGGAAGAFPPVIGWISTEASITLEPILLFLIIFLWTPPHFWALAIVTSNEYEKANIPMMPNVMGNKVTINRILVYSIIMSFTAISPYFIDMVSIIYLIPVSILSLTFVFLAAQLYVSKNDKSIKNHSKKLFIYSIYYLFMVFVIFLVDYTYSYYN